MESTQLTINSDIVHCPYNPTHTMPYKTLQLHLGRCPDKTAKFTKCSFNLEHIILISEKEAHEKNCPNRINLDHILYESQDVKRPDIHVEAAPKFFNSESWDDPKPTESVNTYKDIYQRPHFMKPPSGLTKSERKQYRKDMINNYSSVDPSFNKDCSISKRQDASKSDIKNQEKNLFFGVDPSIT